MIYPLKLNLPIGSFSQPDERRKQVKDKLEGIKDFEKQLSWYNANVRSLATHASEEAQIYYEWGNPDQRLFIFCNCKNCRLKPDFDNKQEAIYVDLRAKEVERLKAGISNAGSYKDKLRFLFDTKGFNPEHTPAIWDGDREEPIIDLQPETAEERRVYNQFVIEEFESEYKQGNSFTLEYTGFNFEKERQRLNERLLQPQTDKPILLQYVKTQIEKHFNYPESLHTDKREKHISSHILKQIDRNLEENGHIHNLFARLCFGEKIDLLSMNGLNSYSLLNYTHVSEIFGFYQYVKQLIEKPENLTKLDFSDSKTLTVENQKQKGKMITESVRNLFSFIDFLHSKMGYFLSKQDLIDKVMELHTKRNSLKPNQNFRDRIEYNKVQAEFEKQIDIINRDIVSVITDKIKEFAIADISTPVINLNAQTDLFNLQRNFNEQDLEEIFKAKRRYVEFRTKINFHFILGLFFHDLDRDLKEFFDYFKETEENEFAAFETKTIQVENIGEAVEQFKNKGIVSFRLPKDFLNRSNVLQSNIEAKQPKEAESWQIVPPQKAILTDEIITPLIEMMALHDFLSVPAPDTVHKNAFSDGKDWIEKQTRLAETNEDFAAICQREFERRNLKNEPAVWVVLYNEVLNHIQYLKQLHKERTDFDKNRDFHLLALADTFSLFVQEQVSRFGTNKKESEHEFSYIEKRVQYFKQLFQQYDFFKLSKVKALTQAGQIQLVELVAKNELPYCIAMFDFLDFLEHLKTHFRTKTDLYIQISKWFDADKQGRTVAGNIRVLSTNTEENKSRYTADRHKETVKNDYERVK